jgi:hypothetical protein
MSEVRPMPCPVEGRYLFEVAALDTIDCANPGDVLFTVLGPARDAAGYEVLAQLAPGDLAIGVLHETAEGYVLKSNLGEAVPVPGDAPVYRVEGVRRERRRRH